MSTSDSGTIRSRGSMIVIGSVLLLLVLHQDNWFWNDGTLVFGFLPIGLFWHALISIGASMTWFMATQIAWPIHQQPAKEQPGNEATGRQGGES